MSAPTGGPVPQQPAGAGQGEDPQGVAAPRAAARGAFARGDVDEAERRYRQALELDPRDAASLAGLGRVWFEARGDPRWGEDLFRQALAIDPGDEEALSGLGRIFVEVHGDPQTAVELIRRAGVDHDDDPASIAYFGWLLTRAGALDEGERHLRQAVAADPSLRTAWLHLFEVLLISRNDAAEAEAVARAGLAADPDNGDLYRELALLLWMGQGRWQEAEELCKHWVATAPSPDAYLGWSNVAEECRGSSVDAAAILELGLAAFPDDPSLLNNLGSLYAEAFGDRQRALACFERAHAADPTDAQTMDNLSVSYWNRGWAQQANEMMWRAEQAYLREVGTGRPDPDSVLSLAQINLYKGDRRAATWWAERALQLRPHSRDAAQLLADLRAGRA